MTATDTPADAPLHRARPVTVPAVIGLLVVGLFLFWDLHNAGSREINWLPGAMLLTAGVLSIVLGSGGLPRTLGRAEAVALASLAGLTAWSLASVGWSAVQGDAWSGANRFFLYLAAFTLFVLLPWSISSATVVLGAYVMGTAAVAALAVWLAPSGSSRFIDGRLSYPTGYPNANAALFLSAFWVALVLATRRSVPITLRVAAAAAAVFLPQVAMLSQSRGSVVAFAVTAVVLLILLPGRLRTAAGIAGATAIIALTWRTHTAVFDAALANEGALGSTVDRSSIVMAATSAGAAMATLLWAVVDTRIDFTPGATRLLDRATAIAAAVLLAVVVVVLAASHPTGRAERAWTNFTAVDATDSSKPHFSLGIGSNRYDFWRVAMARFKARPLTGIGADNFAVDYLRDRRSIEEPAYPHSLWIMMLSQLGIVGTALFTAFLVSAGFAVVPRRRQDPATTAIGGAALAGSVYFLVHASVDWFWEIPALGAPALALLGLAVAVRATGGNATPAGLRLPRLALAAIAGVGVLGIASCALPWLAQRQVDEALATWRADPSQAYADLRTARALNPLSAKPDLLAGVIAARLNDTSRMPTLFARSLERDPHSWYAELELGLSLSVSGDRAGSVAAVRRAIELNPREPLLHDIVRRLRQGEEIAPSSLDQIFLDRIEARTR